MKNLALARLLYKTHNSNQNIFKFIAFRILEPLFHFSFYAIIGITILGNSYLEYILIGNVFFLLAEKIILNFIIIFRNERFEGTLGLNIAAPINMTKQVFFRSLFPFLEAVLSALISFGILTVLYDIRIDWKSIPGVIVFVISSILSLISLALIIASFALLLKNVNLLLNLSLGVYQLFCGVNFPTSLLPFNLEIITKFIPMNNGLLAVRELLKGATFIDVSNLFFREVFVGAVYLILSIVIISILERLSKHYGTLFDGD